jgi:hypothetical protein
MVARSRCTRKVRTAGFIVESLRAAYLGEGLRILRENAAATRDQSDAAMREAGPSRMASVRAHGPHRPRR